jgi:hypothetical protein
MKSAQHSWWLIRRAHITSIAVSHVRTFPLLSDPMFHFHTTVCIGPLRLHIVQPHLYFSSAYYHLSLFFLARLILRTRRLRRHVPLKRRLTFDGRIGVISQKTELFIITAVRTTNPTQENKFIFASFRSSGCSHRNYQPISYDTSIQYREVSWWRI